MIYNSEILIYYQICHFLKNSRLSNVYSFFLPKTRFFSLFRLSAIQRVPDERRQIVSDPRIGLAGQMKIVIRDHRTIALRDIR